jgi:hypothetical protein
MMKINIKDRGYALRNRLSDRLERAGVLRCAEHGLPVVAVDISVRENGWFDSRWTTCCETLEQQARAIVKDRC